MANLALKGFSQETYMLPMLVGLVGGSIGGWKLFGLFAHKTEAPTMVKVLGGGAGAFAGMIGAAALLAAFDK